LHHTERESWSPQYQVSCFLDYLTTKSNVCNGKTFSTSSVLEKIYQDADVILFSTRWRAKDLAALREIIQIIQSDGKIAAISSNTPEQPHTDLTKGTTPFKIFVKNQRRLPDQAERNAIERATYEYAAGNTRIIELNEKLVEIAHAKSAVFLDKMDYVCDTEKEKCSVLTPIGHLINWDYGHYSINGAKFLGGVMKEKSWLRPLHR